MILHHSIVGHRPLHLLFALVFSHVINLIKFELQSDKLDRLQFSSLSKMCCWPFVDVELEDPPKVKKEEEKKEYLLVSDKLHVVS